MMLNLHFSWDGVVLVLFLSLGFLRGGVERVDLCIGDIVADVYRMKKLNSYKQSRCNVILEPMSI